ncbi:amidase [Paeniglutamicibacter sp. NPDC091659]|uniref:amidase n=1 Tax=Paeniglutamicibacter sp. NPDC091659 TaxID=3364389 RepID=UPI00381D707D
MLTPEEYAAQDAVGLATLIRDGAIKAAEAQQAALTAIRDLDPILGAVVEGPFDPPLAWSQDGELAGVPIVLKDVIAHATGIPVHAGSGAFAEGLVYETDSTLVKRFREAGLAIVATTKTPELALSVSTEPRWGGPVHNPWDTSRGAGGSSGGSAALVAAGAVPIGHASDGAGSIRIPAAHNGLVGLKPSRGRVPLGPGQQELFYGNAVELAVTRSVRDTAYLLDLVHGGAPGEKYTAPPPRRQFKDELEAASTPLRIAVSIETWGGEAVHPEVRASLESVARTLEDLGHHVEFVHPDLDWDSFLNALTTMWCAGTSAGVTPLLQGEGDESRFEATTLTCAAAGATLTPADLGHAFSVNNLVSRKMGSFFGIWDVWITPTANQLAPLLGRFDADDPGCSAEDWVRRCVAAYPTCALYNVTGGPAVSLPLAVSTTGLPIGIQLGADLNREDILVRLAAELERALPWAGRRPAIHASHRGVPA